METLRFAARLLYRSPQFSLATVLILAAGIAINTAMFSIVNAVLLRPLPFARPAQLVAIGETSPTAAGSARASMATFLAWSEQQQSLELAAYLAAQLTLTGADPVSVQGSAVSANFFPLLGEVLQHGRSFLAEEDRPAAAPTLIIGHELWRSRFQSDPAVVGRSVRVENRTYTIVGVARPGFDFPAGAQFWTPIQPELPEGYERLVQAKFVDVLGRLHEGVTLDRARQQLSAIARALPANEDWSAHVVPLRAQLTTAVEAPLLILMVAVMFVLLIACANVGNLLLARGAARRHELAIRSALGASHRRITVELLTESVLLGLAAGVLGLLAALWTVDLLIRLSPTELPHLTRVSIDARVLGFTLLMSFATGLLAGALPAVRARVRDLTPILKESSQQTVSDRVHGRVSAALVTGEVALSVVLLIGAGLLMRSFLAMVSVDPGFQAANITTFDLRLPGYRYTVMEQRLFTSNLIERVQRIQGVSSAAVVYNLPISGRLMRGPVALEQRAADPAGPAAHIGYISPGYFRTMGIRLLRGRDFEPADADRGWVAIVNESFARTFFPGEDPIGKRARTLFGPRNMREIVGVVADVHQTALTRPPEPVFYTYAAQDISTSFTLVVRSDLATPTLTSGVRAVVRNLDPDLPFVSVATMHDLIRRSVAQPRFYATLLGTFATLAMLLAMLGLYAVLSQMVAQRRREIGIRLALGARPPDILRLLLNHGLRLTLLGMSLGVAGALVLTRMLSRLLFSVAPADAFTFTAVCVGLLLVALLAMVVPAWRAARLQPLTSLRTSPQRT